MSAGTTSSSAMKAFLTGMPAIVDTDFLVSFTINSQIVFFFNLMINADNTQYVSNPGEMPNNGYTVNFNPTTTPSTGSFDMYKMSGGAVATTFVTGTPLTLTAGTQYTVRFQRVGRTVRFRIWATAGSEPSTWTASYTDGGTVLPANRVGMTILNANASQGVLDYDNVIVSSYNLSGGFPLAWLSM